MVSKTVKWTLFKVRVSRLVRGTVRNIKARFDKGSAGSPGNIFGEDIRPQREINRGKKIKSTAVVLASGIAIGVSQTAAIHHKYGKVISNKGVIVWGVSIGIVIAGIWYKYIPAAEKDVTEDDITTMYELVSETQFGSVSEHAEYREEKIKGFDIFHTMVTGNWDDMEDLEEGPIGGGEINFDDDLEDDVEEEEEERVPDEEDPFRQGAIDFDSVEPTRSTGGSSRFSGGRNSYDYDDDDDDEFEDTRSSRSEHRRMPIGKSLTKSRESVLSRLDRGEFNRKQDKKQDRGGQPEGWLEI